MRKPFGVGIGILAICVIFIVAVGISFAEDINSETELSGDNEVPPTDSDANGEVAATLTENMLQITGTFEDLESSLHDVSGSPAHVHKALAGENGPIIFNLVVAPSDDNMSGTLSLSANLTQEQIDDFRNGRYYVNVHSEDFPSGEIRGQLGVNLSEINDTEEINDSDSEENVTNETADDELNETINQSQAENTITITKHICRQDVQSQAQFDALGSFASKLLACPTVVLAGDEPSANSISGGEAEFDFIVEGNDGNRQSINGSSFLQRKICEANASQDFNNDSDISNETCIDTSGYSYANVERGNIAVIEDMLPEGTRFGSVEFVPETLIANDDAGSLVSVGGGAVQLNTSRDADNNVMVHLFNFLNVNETEGAGNADLHIMNWYPKGPDYVFVCNVSGFTPTSYNWFYGDGHKLINITNQNTYHVYEELGSHTVMCTGTDGVNAASDTMEINVTSLIRPTNPLFGPPTRMYTCINDETNAAANCSCVSANENSASCKCATGSTE